MDHRLIVFMKYPTPGKVKTRIAQSVGNDQATAIHRQLVAQTLQNIESEEWMTHCYISPSEALKEAAQWLGPKQSLFPQEGEGLGERLSIAFEKEFESGASKVVAIGTDSPWLQIDRLREAFTALDQSDLVIGPAEDGGYYLIGTSHYFPQLFKDINWGSSKVFEQTEAITSQYGLKRSLLESGYDVDTIEDFERFQKEVLAWK